LGLHMLRDRNYLDWLKGQSCVLTCLQGTEYNAIDPAHIGTAGKGLKSPDNEALPILHSIHSEMHQRGEMTVMLEYLSRNPRLLRDMARAYARECYQEYLTNRPQNTPTQD